MSEWRPEMWNDLLMVPKAKLWSQQDMNVEIMALRETVFCKFGYILCWSDHTCGNLCSSELHTWRSWLRRGCPRKAFAGARKMWESHTNGDQMRTLRTFHLKKKILVNGLWRVVGESGKCDIWADILNTYFIFLCSREKKRGAMGRNCREINFKLTMRIIALKIRIVQEYPTKSASQWTGVSFKADKPRDVAFLLFL